ncbi:MAG: hypothetical protein Q9162_001810 [Coniocarpon cinnabarinum]
MNLPDTRFVLEHGAGGSSNEEPVKREISEGEFELLEPSNSPTFIKKEGRGGMSRGDVSGGRTAPPQKTVSKVDGEVSKDDVSGGRKASSQKIVTKVDGGERKGDVSGGRMALPQKTVSKVDDAESKAMSLAGAKRLLRRLCLRLMVLRARYRRIASPQKTVSIVGGGLSKDDISGGRKASPQKTVPWVGDGMSKYGIFEEPVMPPQGSISLVSGDVSESGERMTPPQKTPQAEEKVQNFDFG